MSFEWNLSSEEENDLEEDWLQKKEQPEQEAKILDKQLDDESKNPTALAFPKDEESLSSEEEEIDWQDVDTAENITLDGKPIAKPVTIDLDKKPAAKKTASTKKRKRRNVYRYESLPEDLQFLLCNLHRSHLLSLTSHATYVSQTSSDPEILPLALSLVPDSWAFKMDETKRSKAKDPPSSLLPTQSELNEFSSWFFDLVHQTDIRRQQTRAANIAAGAPAQGRRRRNGSRRYRSTGWVNSGGIRRNGIESIASVDQLAGYCSFLSKVNDEDPQLCEVHHGQHSVQLLISMARSLGWRARYVQTLRPVKQDLGLDHPLLALGVKNVFWNVWNSGKEAATKTKPKKKRARTTGRSNTSEPSSEFLEEDKSVTVGWVEILCRSNTSRNSKLKWIHVDPVNRLFDRPDLVESILSKKLGKRKSIPIAYALAAEHCGNVWGEETALRRRLTDVTPRYAQSYSESLKMRGRRYRTAKVVDDWWPETLKRLNAASRQPSKPSSHTIVSPEKSRSSEGQNADDAIVVDESDHTAKDDNNPSSEDEAEKHETAELKASVASEALPTSKAGFNNHPLYAIPSTLNLTEVIAPDAKTRICGVFKGELVYRRSDVSTARPAKKWLYLGRRVVPNCKPVKRIKGRKKASKGFQALKSYGVGGANDGSEEARARQLEAASKPLEDGKEDLFAIWQTEPWSPPPVGPGDPIPVNQHGNIELDLINPGLAHLEEARISVVAKKLGVPYAPCLIGFEGHGGNGTPIIRGIVVHEHNVELLKEAHVEVASQEIEQAHEDRQHAVYQRWKKLLVGILTKKRLDREYGEDS